MSINKLQCGVSTAGDILDRINTLIDAEAALVGKTDSTNTQVSNLANAKVNASAIMQVLGASETNLMSQKAISDEIARLQGLVDDSTNYSAAIYDETNDNVTGEGISTGETAVHKAMRRCLLLDNGIVNYYLDVNDSKLKEDGTASDLTGTDGQVMVEIPKCYVKAVYLQGGSSPILEWSVSGDPKLGYVLHPAFIKDGNLVYNKQLGMWNYENYTKVVDHIYVGAYMASVFDTSASAYIDGLNLDNNSARVDFVTDKLSSVSGKYPMVGLVRSEFRTIAENRGVGWQQLDFWTQSLLQLLYTTEYRNLNSQATVGNGTTNVSGGYPTSSEIQADSPHTIAGKSNAVGNVTGGVDSNTRDVSWMSYRGVEHFWGNCYQWCDGINILDQVAFVNNTSTYTDNTTGSGYTQLGVASPSANGYIRKVQSDTLSYLPLEATGGSTTGFCDYYYQSAGYRVLASGGFAALGASAGAFVWSGHDSSGSRYRYLGGRLVYKEVV